MTYTANIFHPGARLREWFAVAKKASTEHRAQRSTYNRTLHALRSMSDLDLADIDVSRLSIKEIARDAAYDGL